MPEIAESLNLKVADEVDETTKLAQFYQHTDKEREVVSSVFLLFKDTATERNKGFELFDGRTLKEFIQDSVRRFYTTIDEREDIEDWQARVFDPFTRNKVITILGKVASALPISEYLSRGSEDYLREQILNDLKKYADDIDDTEELMFFALLEALVKGTVVGYEGYEEKERKVRDVKDWNSGGEITLKEGTVKLRKVFGSIIPLEDFYPSSVGVRKIKDMPYCFWRTVLTLESFRMHFSQYEKAKYVVANSGNWSGEEAQRPDYADYISQEVNISGKVEVIRYYNQDTDEFVIMANGIWLNPVKEKGKEVIMPIPFNHKTLPFWKAIYEPLGDFFYGKSLCDKLKPMQDVLNVLHNMTLDQSFLSIFPPILVAGTDDIEDDFLRPGRRIPVDDPNAYKELAISAPQGFHQYIMEYTKRVLEETSIDPVQQGMAGQGDRTTATEIRTATAGVISVLGLFANFMKFGIKDKDRLRGKNILQFYKAPLIESILGEGASKEYKEAFNIFKIEDTSLTTGKRGTKIIEMYQSKEKLPTKNRLKAEATIAEKETGRRTEKVAITPDYLRDFEFDVRLVVNPVSQESKSMQKALWMEKAKVYMELFPDFTDREELALQGAEIYGDRPEKMFKKEMFNPPAPQFPQAGNLGISENMVNSQMG